MSSQRVELEVRGYRNEPLEHRYRRQDTEPAGLGLLLPGMGYGLAHPGLRYSALLLDELGFDTFGLETRYASEAFRNVSEEEAQEWLRADFAAALAAARGARNSSQLCVVAKSLGTLGLHLLLTEEPLPPQARLIWLTPLLSRPELRESIRQRGAHSLVVIGTQDPHYQTDWLNELAAAGTTVLVLEGTDHVFENAGDVMASVGNLEKIVGSMKAFLQG
ncbi:hypothetical protein E5F05_11145 [Deinococcus metallilatus]|uniref:Alpha/beta hydrolase n=1 Tax=Deinococcus metallilatus TaxID=1211322 RepID=A0AAJ5F384_9DEIO|nr:hypothetical protein [Deinococcus metallilatus]MBB5296525.1 hypothetical protein [Deinococcus metallilatus]QBY08445.1 hypothetical protein E5F05_11145 [Deinococcus metallilatus]RXJ11244.1 hypothetical protein ERJ73_09965 [Deinococcus metallilatus]TLK24735.1 hypothetical protein FCS05_14400 [Deinococcus metallilatus]GMA17443.1 hypothetical protein GCM10025871_37740 [Deinococcus metallilatus]